MTDKKPWNFEDILKSLRKAIDFSYELERKNKGHTPPWDGPILTTVRLIANTDNIVQTLEDWNEAEKSCSGSPQPDMMDRVLTCAFHLGIEQGYRFLLRDVYMRKMDLRDIKEALDKLETLVEINDETLIQGREAYDGLKDHVLDPGKML